MDTKTEVEEASRSRASLSRRVLNGLLLCTGDMEHLDKYMTGKKTQPYTATCFLGCIKCNVWYELYKKCAWKMHNS